MSKVPAVASAISGLTDHDLGRSGMEVSDLSDRNARATSLPPQSLNAAGGTASRSS